MVVLHLLEFDHKPVVFGVRDCWSVAGIVSVLGVKDALGQLGPVVARLCLSLTRLQLATSGGIVNHGPILAQFT